MQKQSDLVQHKCFFVTLHAWFTKQNVPNKRSGVPLNTLRWDPCDSCTKLFEPRKSERYFTAFVRTTDSSDGLCRKANAHLFTVSRQDSTVIVVYICFDAMLAFSVIKLLAIERQWAGPMVTASCSGGSVYANVCAQVMSSCTLYPWSTHKQHRYI